MGHEVVGQGNRLGPLEVGVAGHNGPHVRLGFHGQGELKGLNSLDDLIDRLPKIEPKRSRHLIVS